MLGVRGWPKEALKALATGAGSLPFVEVEGLRSGFESTETVG